MPDVLRILDLTYPLIVLLAVLIALHVFRRRQPRLLAQRILNQQKAIWATPNEFRPVSPEDFRDLDLEFYDSTQAVFEAQGFRYLADLQNLTLSATFPWSRAFSRYLVNADGTVWVTIYDIRIRGWMALAHRLQGRKDFRTVSLTTVFSDGSSLTTANSLGTDNSSVPAACRRYQYAKSTTPAELLEHHLWALDQVLQYDPNLYARPHETLEELMATWHEIQAQRNAHYEAMGYMNEEELGRLAGRSNKQVLHQVAQEIERLKQQTG